MLDSFLLPRCPRFLARFCVDLLELSSKVHPIQPCLCRCLPLFRISPSSLLPGPLLLHVSFVVPFVMLVSLVFPVLLCRIPFSGMICRSSPPLVDSWLSPFGSHYDRPGCSAIPEEVPSRTTSVAGVELFNLSPLVFGFSGCPPDIVTPTLYAHSCPSFRSPAFLT